jgi:hypothetical protein
VPHRLTSCALPKALSPTCVASDLRQHVEVDRHNKSVVIDVLTMR